MSSATCTADSTVAAPVSSESTLLTAAVSATAWARASSATRRSVMLSQLAIAPTYTPASSCRGATRSSRVSGPTLITVCRVTMFSLPRMPRWYDGSRWKMSMEDPTTSSAFTGRWASRARRPSMLAALA